MEYKRRVKQCLVFFILMILFYYSASAGLLDVYKKGEIDWITAISLSANMPPIVESVSLIWKGE
jgi:hypothetical protein